MNFRECGQADFGCHSASRLRQQWMSLGPAEDIGMSCSCHCAMMQVPEEEEEEQQQQQQQQQQQPQRPQQQGPVFKRAGQQ